MWHHQLLSYFYERDPVNLDVVIEDNSRYFSPREDNAISNSLSCLEGLFLLLTSLLVLCLHRPSCMLLLPAGRSFSLTGFQPVILRIVLQNRCLVDFMFFVLLSVHFNLCYVGPACRTRRLTRLHGHC